MNLEQEMYYGNDYKYIPATSVSSGQGVEVAPDVYCYTVQIVNLLFIGNPKEKEFVLVDAGMPGSADSIIEEAEERFGTGCRPKAIILTHGHFDHVGAIIELIKHWNVPVYAHKLELPFLTGKQSYVKPDPGVEGGWVAKMSFYFPNEPIQLGSHVSPLPEDGTVPCMPGFRWLHTPGHTVGHIALYRDSDRLLIAGDAFVTVKQEYLYKVITQEQEISGPPRYFTPDWGQAKNSVQTLANLSPFVAVTGHGKPMSGEILSTSLKQLSKDFDEIARPDYGRYLH